MSGNKGGTIGGIIGATIGFVFGGPQGALIGFNIGYTAGTALMPPELEAVQGPRLQDLKVQTSTYGTPLPFLYGANRIAGNIIWLKGNRIQERRIVTEVGGKGGPSQEQITFEYYATLALSLCEGEIKGVRKIWADSNLIYDVSASTTPESAFQVGSLQAGITIYKGTTTQSPDPVIEAEKGEGLTPAYRGTAYILFEDFALKKYGNRIPNFTVEVLSEGLQSANYLGEATYTITAGASFTRRAYHTLSSTGTAFAQYGLWDTDYTNQNVTVVAVLINGTVNTRTFTALGSPGNRQGSIGSSDRPVAVTVERASNGKVYIYEITDDLDFTASAPGAVVREPVYGGNNYDVSSGSIQIVGDYVYFLQYADVDGTIRRASFAGTDSIPQDATTLFQPNSQINGTAYQFYVDSSYIYILSTNSYLSVWTLEGVLIKEFLITPDVAFTLNYGAPTTMQTETPGQVYILSSKNLHFVDISDESYEYIGVLTDMRTTAVYPGDWHVRNGMMSQVTPTAGAVDYWQLISLTDNIVPLSTVVSDLCQRSALLEADIDVTGLSRDVAGFVHTKPGPARADFNILKQAYHFDAVESGYKIKFIHRGGASALTLTSDDLAAHEYGQERPENLIEVRDIETGLPHRVHVTYIDPARDYDPGDQYAERLVTESVHLQKTQLPLSLTPTEAGEVSEILLYDAWMTRRTYEFSLPYKYSYLEPSDLVTISLDGYTYLMRIVSTEVGAQGLMQCKAVRDEPSIYTSTALGETALTSEAYVQFDGPTIFRFIDTSILQDADDNAGVYFAGNSAFDNWQGCTLMRSDDQGESYFRVDAAIEPAPLGTTTTTLPSGPTEVLDESSTVTVQMTNGTLSSVTETALIESNANLAVIGDHGRWEIFAFRDATLVAADTYQLSGLIRGYRGTEWAVGLHQTGDKFVMLSTTYTFRYLLDSALIDAERYYKAVTFGLTLIGTDEIIFTNTAEGLAPYSPVHIEGSRDGSGNLTITWIRRTRIGGEWTDGADVPLGEDSESYEVDILESGSPDNVLRTIAVSSETASYTAAQQTTDFGSPQSSISIEVYQLSATVGRGHAGVATV